MAAETPLPQQQQQQPRHVNGQRHSLNDYAPGPNGRLIRSLRALLAMPMTITEVNDIYIKKLGGKVPLKKLLKKYPQYFTLIPAAESVFNELTVASTSCSLSKLNSFIVERGQETYYSGRSLQQWLTDVFNGLLQMIFTIFHYITNVLSLPKQLQLIDSEAVVIERLQQLIQTECSLSKVEAKYRRTFGKRIDYKSFQKSGKLETLLKQYPQLFILFKDSGVMKVSPACRVSSTSRPSSSAAAAATVEDESHESFTINTFSNAEEKVVQRLQIMIDEPINIYAPLHRRYQQWYQDSLQFPIGRHASIYTLLSAHAQHFKVIQSAEAAEFGSHMVVSRKYWDSNSVEMNDRFGCRSSSTAINSSIKGSKRSGKLSPQKRSIRWSDEVQSFNGVEDTAAFVSEPRAWYPSSRVWVGGAQGKKSEIVSRKWYPTAMTWCNMRNCSTMSRQSECDDEESLSGYDSDDAMSWISIDSDSEEEE